MGWKGKNVPQTQYLKLKKKFPQCSPAELRKKYYESCNFNESQPAITSNSTLSKNLLPSKPEQQSALDLAPNNHIYSLNLEPISPSISDNRVKETSELVPSTSEPVLSISEPVQGTSEMTKGTPEPVPGIPEPIPEPIPNTPALDILKQLVNNLDSGLLD